MRLTSCRKGDVVELAGDEQSLWLVERPPESGHLAVMLRGRPFTLRTVSSRDVVGHWRRARASR
jgi:hypothetical protein